MLRLSIIGAGYVGLVTAVCFAEKGYKVISVDRDVDKIDKLNNGVVPIYEHGLNEMCTRNLKEERIVFTTDTKFAVENSDIIFIAVGTPPAENGEADLSHVISVANDIGRFANGDKLVVNKSTVPIGTKELVDNILNENSIYKFNVVSNPEFLREGTAVFDTLNADRIIIGCDNNKAEVMMKELYKDFSSQILVVSPRTAEMIKYAANTFLALKVSYINEVANICEKLGANVIDVSRGIGLDDRIGLKFLRAGIGFGGACFPKDVLAINNIAAKNGYTFKLAQTLLEINESQKIKPVEKLLRLMSGNIKEKNIALLGLSFKPGTDDMRGAPSIKIIELLRLYGANVSAYDPVAIDNAKKVITVPVKYCASIEETVKEADAIIICTEWDLIKTMDLNKISKIVNNKCIIDGRNCIDSRYAKSAGFNYYGIGIEEDTYSVESQEAAISKED